MVTFWEVVDRAVNTGPPMVGDQFDTLVYTTAARLVEKYGIKFDPKNPIPTDDGLVDAIFAAGKELYTTVGTYCTDTGRVMRFTPDEVAEALRDLARMPSEIPLGEGTELRIMRKRKISDPVKPLYIGGTIDPESGEGRDMVQQFKSFAQELVVDGVYYSPPPRGIEGRPYTIDSPFDLHATRSAVRWVREALRAVGRPGMPIIDGSNSAIGVLAACDPHHGLRKCDAVSIPIVSELKTNFNLLNKVALTMDYGCYRNPFWTIIIGGFAGGPEGSAVVSVATAFNAMLVYQVVGRGFVMPSNILAHPPVTSHRMGYFVRSASLQVFARHTNLICGGCGSLAAGPGTVQQLYEIAAKAITISVSGGHITHGFRKSKCPRPNMGTGVEARFGAETARAAAGLSRPQANELLNCILTKFEGRIGEDLAPEGHTLEELYDVERVQVKPHYLELYETVKADLRSRGLSYD